MHPEWGPVAPTSPRCWGSKNNIKQVHLPTLAPSSPPHSPSSCGCPRTRLPHALLRVAQVAMMALLGAREHLEHPPARIELLYNIIRRSMGHLGRGWASLRVQCDRAACTRHRLPGDAWTRTYPWIPPQYLFFLRMCNTQVCAIPKYVQYPSVD